MSEYLSENLFENDDWKTNIVKICDLKRSSTPLISKVVVDDYIKNVSTCFDFDYDGENKFFPFLNNEIIKNLDFNILVITGASGSGKSTFSKYFGDDTQIEWNNEVSIMSNFSSPKEAVEKLSAVGLNSIPTMCKPRNVLSVGEGFRADVARKLKSNCVIDEFTSTVDRNVAFSCSRSISKYIRDNDLKKCVFVSCHKDFIDCLCPDYVIDLDDECVYDARGLLRRKFELCIYETTEKSEMWQIFKQHHYLTSDLNTSSKVFIGYLNNEPVSFCAILPQPGVHNLPGGVAWRVHRLVVLPDYQGLGIATKMLEYLCDMFAYHDKIVYLRTSHHKLINYMRRSSCWSGDGKMMKSTQNNGSLASAHCYTDRLSASFKYLKKCSNNSNYSYDKISFPSYETERYISKYSTQSLW